MWCVDAAGKSGWLPEQALAIDGDQGRALWDFDAIELTVAAGDRVTGHERLNGWVWCVNARGAAGWVPLDKVRPVASPPSRDPV